VKLTFRTSRFEYLGISALVEWSNVSVGLATARRILLARSVAV